jgi:integrase
MEILARRWQDNQNRPSPSTFVFPAINPKGKTGHMNDIRDSWESMLQRAGISDFRIHDLRRSLGSWQTITGASTAIVGKSLGHKSQQTTAVYARMHLDPVRQSIEKAVEAMRAAQSVPVNVVPIQKTV